MTKDDLKRANWLAQEISKIQDILNLEQEKFVTQELLLRYYDTYRTVPVTANFKELWDLIKKYLEERLSLLLAEFEHIGK